VSHVGGRWLLVPYPELSLPFLLFSLALMTAQLQQHSIYNWAQSEHQSAASGTGVVVATRSHIILAARALLPSTSK
jgi:hypothetical protein